MLLSSFSLFAKNSPIKKYHVEEVSAEPFIEKIQRTGKVNFKRTVNLSFKTSGFLTLLSVDEGDIFSENKLLAALDTTELKEDKNAKYAQLLQAKRDVNRIQKLLAKELSSEQAHDDAKTLVETARAAYQIAYYNLEKAQVLAPFNGVVVARYTELGELQSPSQVALQVAALENNLVIKVALTGEEISLVKLNQAVQVSLAHLGIVEGKISKIPAMADSQSHLFNIEVLLPKMAAGKPLIAGQLAQITIHINSHDFVYRLPIAALNGVNPQGKALVALKDKGKLRQQAFDIYKLDNSYLYLYATETVKPLSVITQGWQHLSLSVNE
ncbi:MAG: efflux RND transporter periplasmic adaptor subunit [Colwellia sp.]